MTTAEVVAAVGRERERLRGAIASLRGGASTVPVTDGGWTAQDVLAHCIHWAGQVAWGMGARMETPPWVAGVAGRPSGDEWNARVVRHYRGRPFDEVARDFDRAVDALVERAAARTDTEMAATDAIPWGGDRPLYEQIGAETFDHWPKHARDIERAAAQRVT